MSCNGISPLYWSFDELVSQGNDIIHGLAVRAVGTKTSYHLLLGRCLAAGKSSGLFADYGCHSAGHYAAVVLGVSERVATEGLRVAVKLEELPLLRSAGEEGAITWCKLREVTRKATRATERFWFELCKHRTYAQIEKLVSHTEPGELPAYTTSGQGESLHCKTELRCILPPLTAQIVARGLEALADQHGRHISMSEALEMVFGEVLAKAPDEKAMSSVRKEAAKDVAAAEDRLRRMIEEAREFARQMGCLATEEPARVSEEAGTGKTAHEDGSAKPARVSLGSGESGEADEAKQVEVAVEPARSDASPENLEEPARVGGGEATVRQGKWEWTEMVGAKLAGCLTDKLLNVVERGKPTWRNKNLRFKKDARGLTTAQRRDLLRRDGYCCQVPGCSNRLWLQAHHLIWYSLGGPTATWNLLFLCPCCHKNHHEGRIKIIGCPEDGTLTFLDKSSRKLGSGSPLERAAWLDAHFGWSGNSELDSRTLKMLSATTDGPDT